MELSYLAVLQTEIGCYNSVRVHTYVQHALVAQLDRAGDF